MQSPRRSLGFTLMWDKRERENRENRKRGRERGGGGKREGRKLSEDYLTHTLWYAIRHNASEPRLPIWISKCGYVWMYC